MDKILTLDNIRIKYECFWVPFWGYMLAILAALLLVAATNISGLPLSLETSLSHNKLILSSTPLTPRGMLAKSSRPNSPLTAAV